MHLKQKTTKLCNIQKSIYTINQNKREIYQKCENEITIVNLTMNNNAEISTLLNTIGQNYQ